MAYQPGAAWTGNRKGRPRKGQAMADLLRAALARPYAPDGSPPDGSPDGSPPGQTYGQRLAEVYVQAAVDGNLEAARWVVERADGAVPRAASAYPESLDVSIGVEHRHTLSDDAVAAVLAYVAAQRGLLPGRN